jgi:hypothetical protein
MSNGLKRLTGKQERIRRGCGGNKEKYFDKRNYTTINKVFPGAVECAQGSWKRRKGE